MEMQGQEHNPEDLLSPVLSVLSDGHSTFLGAGLSTSPRSHTPWVLGQACQFHSLADFSASQILDQEISYDRPYLVEPC